MIEYTRYKNACKIKADWEAQRRKIQHERKLRRSLGLLILGDDKIDLPEKFKASIISLGYEQSKKYLELKHALRDRDLHWAVKIIRDEVERIREARNEYRRMFKSSKFNLKAH